MAEFKKWLKDYESKKLQATSRYAEALKNLDEVKDGLAKLLGKHRIAVVLEQGGAVNMGQQYQLKLNLAQGFHEHILFRAYVAGGGTISFDFYDEDVTDCDGTDRGAVLRVVEQFLDRDSTIGIIQQLIDIAKKTPVNAMKDRIKRNRAQKRSPGSTPGFQNGPRASKRSIEK